MARSFGIIALAVLLFTLTGIAWSQSCQSIDTDCGFFGIDQAECERRNCCWTPQNSSSSPWCRVKTGNSSNDSSCDVNAPRRDCGFLGIDQQGCEKKGCCWSPKNNEPWCFYKQETTKYVVDSVQKTDLGVKITVVAGAKNVSNTDPLGPPISPLVVEISAQTSERLHVKIYDPNNQRWEIPTSISSAPADPTSLPSPLTYKYTYADKGSNFAFSIIRADDSDVIFDASNLLFYDQYISLTTGLPVNNNIYGIGEHVTPYLKLKPRTYTLWNYDTPTPQYLNLYGSHPFYLDLRSSGKAHGVYLRNSNGMDMILEEESLSYNVIGGVLDLYFFLGPQPEGVIQQYQEVIGRPHFPPYWALGFHQCRYGYSNFTVLQDVVDNYNKYQIPLDTIWSDIDYMDHYKDFTLDPVNFPPDQMKPFVDSLHKNGQQYVHIVDPGIKVEKGYEAYDDGIAMDVFIKDSNNSVFTGKVWPGITAFPDFFHPKASQYWTTQIEKFHTILPADGLWIDMNEISNFCNGECTSLTEGRPNKQEYFDTIDDHDKWLRSTVTAKRKTAYTGFDPVSPPYAIDNQGNRVPLETKAISTDCTHYGNVLEYDVHNLFGLTEAIATNQALETIRKSRSLVISRSTFPGSGVHTGHWTGDNHAEWEDLYTSIPDVLNFQMFGVPLVGADICGFQGDTNEELCGRWMQLGAFYPFSRNHNTPGTVPQEAYRWTSVAAISRTVLGIRYSLLPYYYTLFYKAHRDQPDPKAPPAAMVLKPLFFEFPTDSNTYEIDKQFLIGSGILISPVLEQGASKVDAYFPSGVWYDFYTLQVETDKGQITKTLKAPIDHIPIHIHGGTVIPMHQPALTTAASRQTPLSLMVALDENGEATGDLFYDDGGSLDFNNFIFVDYTVSNGELKAQVSGPGYSDISSLDTVTVIGVSTKPTQVSVNGQAVSDFQYDDSNHSLVIPQLKIDTTKDFHIQWK